jgi:hypothetical protein
MNILTTIVNELILEIGDNLAYIFKLLILIYLFVKIAFKILDFCISKNEVRKIDKELEILKKSTTKIPKKTKETKTKESQK